MTSSYQTNVCLVSKRPPAPNVHIAVISWEIFNLGYQLLNFLTHQGRDKGDAISQRTFSNAFSWKNVPVWILIKISLRFVPKGPITNIPVLNQIMACHWPGNKPLSEPMRVSLLMDICVTSPQWVDNELMSLTGIGVKDDDFKSIFIEKIYQFVAMNIIYKDLMNDW